MKRHRPAAPAPPARLGDDARAAWAAVAPKLLELGLLLPIDEPLLAVFCTRYILHVHAVEALATCPPRARAMWRRVRDYARAAARRQAAEFLVLPHERVHLAQLGRNGEDLELRRLFTPGAPAQRVPLSLEDAANLAHWNRRWRAAERQ